MPHPLPEDIDSVSGLKWFLAAVPDDPAFTRAAWDVFTELANYWKWGKEGPVPEDSDKAAQLWSTAVYETIEAYKMGFPEDLLNYIDEVEGLLRALQSVPCCDAPTVSYQGGYDPNTQSEIEDGVGDPPATYGDDPITTWAEWDDYKCEAAYFMVERAAALCEDLADIASWDTPLNAEIIGLALGRIPAVGDVFKAAWELVWQLLELSWDTIVDLETAAGEIRADADDIACAIFEADGPDAAAAGFKSAVQDAVTQTGASLVVPWFPYRMWANIIYEGTFVNAEGTTVAIDSYLTPGTNDCCAPGSVFYNMTTFGTNEETYGIWSPQNSVEMRTDDVRLNTPNGQIVISDQAWGGPVDITLKALIIVTAAGRAARLNIEGVTQDFTDVGTYWAELTVSAANSSPYTLSVRNVGDGPLYIEQAEVIVDPS